MSFVLDALKKSQSVHRSGEVALNLTESRPWRLPMWIAATLLAALLVNGALLVWIFVFDSNPLSDETVSATQQSAPAVPPPAAATTNVSANSTAPDQRGPSPERIDLSPSTAAESSANRSQQQAQQRQSTPAAREPSSPAEVRITPRTASASRATSIDEAPPQTRTPQTPGLGRRGSQGATTPGLVTYKLEDLASDEREFFDDFKYTTHIYTEDPALCAIVVNGERLQAGSEFSGLIVKEITPDGAVFEQSTTTGKRLVSVSVIEQWAN